MRYDDCRNDAWEQRPDDDEYSSGVDLMPVSVLADAVHLLLDLPKDALDVVRLRYGGMPYKEIAENLGMGIDAVEKRHCRTMVKNPVLGSLFPRKVRKQAARRRRGKVCR
jgi:DNA-directed RNA polymerase specialized sigma24 family protein